MSDARHRLFFVHGMGTVDPTADYQDLESRLRAAWQGRASFDDRFRIQKLVWSGSTYAAKRALFFDSFGREPVELGVETALHPILAMRSFMTLFIGDVVAYTSDNDNGIRRAFWSEVRAALPDADLEAGATFSFVAHSLGSVIAYDFVWHLLFDDRGAGALFSPLKNEPALVPSLRRGLRGLYTMGSPIGLFLLRRGDLWMPPHDKPPFSNLLNPMHERTWLNFCDPQDVIAFPLEKLFDTTGKPHPHAPRDVQVQTGDLVVNSHLGYWRSVEVADAIAAELAG